MTLYENVTISKIERDVTQNEIYDLLDQVNQKEMAEALPNRLDTILSAEFDGIELSGGQWQRIAITRGLHREHDIIPCRNTRGFFQVVQLSLNFCPVKEYLCRIYFSKQYKE